MAAATMLPASLPAVGFIGLNSFKANRLPLATCFLTGYLAVWSTFVALVYVLLDLSSAQTPGHFIGGRTSTMVFVLAALWQLTSFKTRALSLCHLGPMLPASLGRAFAVCLSFGVRHGWQCILSCWLLMLAVHSSGREQLAVCAVVSLIVFVERTYPRTPITSRLLAATVLMLGVSLMWI
jgi:predicted metal-binding membrane protein